MNLAIYGHGGSENHGNEAIVRGVCELFPDAHVTLYTFSQDADKHFGLGQICDIHNMKQDISKNLILRISDKLFHNFKTISNRSYKVIFKPFLDNINKDTVYLLEAGDQYCESVEHRQIYAYLNKQINKKGAKSVMLGCTINPSLLVDRKLLDDINRYSLVIARESITYDALLKADLHTKILLAPCPAFAMKAEAFDYPAWMQKKEFIGFNVGFLQQGNEKYYELLIENYKNAIRRVISETDYDVALIPHVNWNYSTTDFTALDELYLLFKDSGRLHYLEEHNAPQQKYFISHCRAFVALRTHAMISGLASHVPTLITGYKIKSKGIANDVFGDHFEILADVQSLDSELAIADKLFNILKNESDIRDYYLKNMLLYINRFNMVVSAISDLSSKY